MVSAVGTSGPAFIGYQTLMLAKAIAASSTARVIQRLKDLPERPGVRTRIAELFRVAQYANGLQLIRIVRTSRMALALGKNPKTGGMERWW